MNPSKISLGQTIPIFCLSLPRAVDRRQKILETWGGLGFVVTFVDAPDRRDFESIKKTHSLSLNGYRVSEGEICCLLGFVQIMDMILALPASRDGAIAMEDDAIPLIANEPNPVEYLEKIIHLCQAEFPSAQAILMHDHPTKRKGKIAAEGVHCDSLIETPMMGTTMFYMSKAGAAYCKEWFLRLTKPADWVFTPFAEEMTLLVTKPRLARHPTNREGATTYISNGGSGRGTRRKYIP